MRCSTVAGKRLSIQLAEGLRRRLGHVFGVAGPSTASRRLRLIQCVQHHYQIASLARLEIPDSGQHISSRQRNRDHRHRFDGHDRRAGEQCLRPIRSWYQRGPVPDPGAQPGGEAPASAGRQPYPQLAAVPPGATWNFNFNVDLIFDDGSNLLVTQNGVDLTPGSSSVLYGL